MAIALGSPKSLSQNRKTPSPNPSPENRGGGFGMASNYCKRHAYQQSGYVLIMTLVIITIAALSLAGLARRSLLLASESIAAERELQRYWGANSCRRFLLDQAGKIFENLETPHAEGELPWPAPRQFAANIQLAGMTYRMWLSDEDAKLNLNALTARLPQQRRVLLAQLTGHQNLLQRASLQLTPDTSLTAKRQKRWFSSWGQMVDISVRNTGAIDSLMELAKELTCWGSGKLNIRRVSDQTLVLVAGKLVNQQVAQKLLEARTAATDIEWKELVKSLALRRRDALALRTWFSDKSTCYSLWLELDDGQRRWYHQWVQGDRSSATADSVLSFRW